MTLSRKDFFRQGFFSLGETLLKAGEAVREMRAPVGPAPAAMPAQPETASGTDLVARADNRHCMAKHCGCFSCLERCEPRAISLVMGTGISIDASLCTGCGACRDICPVAPKGVELVSRT